MKKKLLSLALALTLCSSLTSPVFAAAETSAGEGSGIEAPEFVTITNVTAQEEPVLEAAGWWTKRVYCESGATLTLTPYVNSETGEEIIVDSAWIYKGKLDVFYIDPYLCAEFTMEDEEGECIEPGDGIFPLEDGEWWIEVMPAGEEGSRFPVEHIYVNVGGSPAPSVRFTDVPDGAWYADAVSWAVDKGITSGTGADTFSPEKTCTRGEIITFLWRAAGRMVPAWRPGLPSDAGEDEFYTAPVEWAATSGLFSGDKFAPNAPCTRAMAVDFLWRYAGCPEAAPAGQFTDVPTGGDLAKAVAWAVENGVTFGTSGTTFSPNDTCTRGQIVTFLYRALAQ